MSHGISANSCNEDDTWEEDDQNRASRLSRSVGRGLPPGFPSAILATDVGKMAQ
jgi:hypothetical protein